MTDSAALTVSAKDIQDREVHPGRPVLKVVATE
jgi:hypothetical protein